MMRGPVQANACGARRAPSEGLDSFDDCSAPGQGLRVVMQAAPRHRHPGGRGCLRWSDGRRGARGPR